MSTVRRTRWSVITGAPCSGKTAVIDELARRGRPVVPETARAVIDQELARGRRLEEIKADPAVFEGRIFRTKLALEGRLPPEEPLFLDRGLPDSIAYFTLEGLDPQEPRAHCLRIRYHRVFLFERLEFLKDPVRSENDDTAALIERLIEAAYTELGYSPVRVPVLRIPERAEYVLARV
ncbi:MAG: ATP-binding protein [Desulfobacterales bacterium]|jgi:predicted ATPase|nr:ATP-binding protein [Desulfobacterales bacterium]